MTFSEVSATSAADPSSIGGPRGRIRAVFLSLLLFLPSACVSSYHIKENLSPQQIIDPAIIRKPTRERTWGILPVYQDFLEGYIRGGLVGVDGQGLQGVSVKVITEKGKDAVEFVPGVTDSAGIYKIRFSLPILWSRIDFNGALVVGPEWTAKTPQTHFRIYFSRRNGVLACSPREAWMTLQAGSEIGKKSVLPAAGQKPPAKSDGPSLPSGQDKKKGEDIFGNFSFGP